MKDFLKTLGIGYVFVIGFLVLMFIVGELLAHVSGYVGLKPIELYLITVALSAVAFVVGKIFTETRK